MSDSEVFVKRCRTESMLVEHVMAGCYKELLKSESKFAAIDGGAHAGFHTTRLANLPGCQKVFAIEAAANMAERLRRLPAHDADIEVVEAAVQRDPERETVTFKISSTHPGRSGISPIWQDTPEVVYADVTVAATTLDTLAASVKAPVLFVKLDLEGGEFDALRGGERLLRGGQKLVRRNRPVIGMENSIRAARTGGFDRADVYAFFKSLDYVPMTFWGEPMNTSNEFAFWYAWAVPREKAKAMNHIAADAIAASNAQAGE